MSLAALASAPGGPGRLLLANEPVLRRAVERTARTLGSDLSFVDSAVDGQTLLSFGEEPRVLAERVLTSPIGNFVDGNMDVGSAVDGVSRRTSRAPTSKSTRATARGPSTTF